jgi:hypothetical protein
MAFTYKIELIIESSPDILTTLLAIAKPIPVGCIKSLEIRVIENDF